MWDRNRRATGDHNVEEYRRQTQQVIKRFLAHKLSFPDCIAALDAVLADLIPRLRHKDLSDLRTVMLTNNEIVMKEMERRGPPSPSRPCDKRRAGSGR